MTGHQPTFLGRLSIGLLIVIIGVPAALLLITGTSGTVLIPLIVAVCAAPLFLLHYLLWGRALSRRVNTEVRKHSEETVRSTVGGDAPRVQRLKNPSDKKMNLVPVTFLALVLTADSEAPPAPDARQLIERSLPFLEKGAAEWVETKKCVTRHHVPMMLWTHYEARRQGFAVNETAVRKLEAEALGQYLGHADFTPTGQDTSFMEKGLGPGTIYLSLAMKANPSPGRQLFRNRMGDVGPAQDASAVRGREPGQRRGPVTGFQFAG